MSFDWSEYLTLAQELTSKATTSPIQEAHFRCAISRAYYAAFCKARNLLLTKDGYSTRRGKNVHWDVVDKFENSSDITRQHIGCAGYIGHLSSKSWSCTSIIALISHLAFTKKREGQETREQASQCSMNVSIPLLPTK